MRRFAVDVALAGAGVLVVRAAAPRLHARMMAACERMFEEMPESFPPRQMLRGIEEIKANSVRTLELLDGRKPLGRAASNNRRSPGRVRVS